MPRDDWARARRRDIARRAEYSGIQADSERRAAKRRRALDRKKQIKPAANRLKQIIRSKQQKPVSDVDRINRLLAEASRQGSTTRTANRPVSIVNLP